MSTSYIDSDDYFKTERPAAHSKHSLDSFSFPPRAPVQPFPGDKALSVECPVIQSKSRFVTHGGKYWMSAAEIRGQKDDEELQHLLTVNSLNPNYKFNGGYIFVPPALDSEMFNSPVDPTRRPAWAGQFVKGHQQSRNAHHPLINPKDLDNLLFIHPKEVARVLSELEKCANTREGKPVTLLFTTGGTITSNSHTINGATVSIPSLSGDTLIDSVGAGGRRYQVVCSAFPTVVDSSDMRAVFLRDIVILLSYIWSKASDDLKTKFMGVMITHGTDTKAWSASKLAHMLGPDLPFPVALVSSQHVPSAIMSDANENIHLGLVCLDKLTLEKRNTLVVVTGGRMGGALPGAVTHKVSNTSALAFDAPGYGWILHADKVEAPVNVTFCNSYTQAKTWRPIVVTRFYEPSDVAIRLEQEIRPEEVYEKIKLIHDKGHKVFFIEAFGSFTAQTQTILAVKKACSDFGMSAVATNVIPGTHDFMYQQAVELGKVAELVNMPTTAAVHKYSLAREMFGHDALATSKIIEFIVERDWVGEIMPSHERPTQSPARLLGTDGISDDILPNYDTH